MMGDGASVFGAQSEASKQADARRRAASKARGALQAEEETAARSNDVRLSKAQAAKLQKTKTRHSSGMLRRQALEK